uniref:BHLH domain-containing protein n=1 Tax=Brassica oleracea TaxID=3712 RepID=A0A3P6DQN2_BRAOL|nr:unnamed protein product [Brassica oleracea]
MLNRRPSRARGVRQVSGENVGSKDGKSMTMLQDLVPGCNWITGKTVMLDEIINYVQSLQRQVDFLSMLVLLYPQRVLNFHTTLCFFFFEVVLLGSSQEIFCVLLVDVSTSSEDRNLRLLCSHAINDIQDASVGLGLQVITLQFKEGTEYNFITGSIEKTTVLLKIMDSQAMEPICSFRENIQMEMFEKEIRGGL